MLPGARRYQNGDSFRVHHFDMITLTDIFQPVGIFNDEVDIAACRAFHRDGFCLRSTEATSAIIVTSRPIAPPDQTLSAETRATRVTCGRDSP